MTRKPRDQLFKKNDLYRLIEAARAKNLPIARIKVIRDGYELIVGEPATGNGYEDKTNVWDEVLTHAADKKRPA